MPSLLPPSAESYLLDWSITLAIGGAVCSFLGFACGWIIWRKARRFTVTVEERNRSAFAEYEKTSDEVSRLKSELTGAR